MTSDEEQRKSATDAAAAPTTADATTLTASAREVTPSAKSSTQIDDEDKQNDAGVEVMSDNGKDLRSLALRLAPERGGESEEGSSKRRQSPVAASSSTRHLSQQERRASPLPSSSSPFTSSSVFETAAPSRRSEVLEGRSDSPMALGEAAVTSSLQQQAQSSASTMRAPRADMKSGLSRELGRESYGQSSPLSSGSLTSGSLRYLLHILQQPTSGCAFGSNLLARLALAPPLIVQLQIFDRAGREVPPESPFLVCRVQLLTGDGTVADMLSPVTLSAASGRVEWNSSAEEAHRRTKTSTMASEPEATTAPSSSPAGAPTSANILTVDPPNTSPSASAQNSASASTSTTSILIPRSSSPLLPTSTLPPPLPSVRLLYGTLVASPLQLYTQADTLSTIFVFPEISVRSRGRFRLQVSLLTLPLPSSAPQPSATLATATTEPFSVVLAGDYVAPHITELTRHFASQGVGLLLPPKQTGD